MFGTLASVICLEVHDVGTALYGQEIVSNTKDFAKRVPKLPAHTKRSTGRELTRSMQGTRHGHPAWPVITTPSSPLL